MLRRYPFIIFAAAMPVALVAANGAMSIAEEIKRERSTFLTMVVRSIHEESSMSAGWEYIVSRDVGCRMKARVNWIGAELRVVTKPNGMPDCDTARVKRTAREESTTYVVLSAPSRKWRSEPVGIKCTHKLVDGWTVKIEQPVVLKDGWPKCGPPPTGNKRIASSNVPVFTRDDR